MHKLPDICKKKEREEREREDIPTHKNVLGKKSRIIFFSLSLFLSGLAPLSPSLSLSLSFLCRAAEHYYDYRMIKVLLLVIPSCLVEIYRMNRSLLR